jgi:rfaE bifunctional protein nucleotidyltransferase chain/domain
MNKLETSQNKIADLNRLRSLLALWRFQDKKIVFTNGCFDILHLGHVDYLSKAADLGDVLVLGLNTDASVSRIKGPSRPVLDQHARATLLASLHFVTLVVLFDEPTPYELIQIVQPDILVKGKDYKAEDVVGYDIVTAKGGRVETIDLVEGYSTSAIISRILNNPPQGL